MLLHIRKKIYINPEKNAGKYFQVAIPSEFAYIFADSDFVAIQRMIDNKGLILMPAKMTTE